MNRGVMFTVMAYLLVFSLMAFAMAFSGSADRLRDDYNYLISADKVNHAFESIRDEMQRSTLLTVSRDNTSIVLTDSLPRSISKTTLLTRYEKFIDQKTGESFQASFSDGSGNNVSWGSIRNLTITPFNITYRYPNVGDVYLESRYKNYDQLDHLELVEIYMQVNQTLDDLGFWVSRNTCDDPEETYCVTFRFLITDGPNLWNSGYENLDIRSESLAIQLLALPNALVRLKPGNAGSGDDRLVGIEVDGPIGYNSSIMYVFDTADFEYVNDGPVQLSVGDSRITRRSYV